MASIQTNLAANSALLNIGVSGMGLNKEITRLSSGFRINNSGDDAAGLAIANKLRGEGASLTVASRNAAQASSMLQIADGATNTVSNILDRLKELATESNSATIGTQRSKLDAEFQSLIGEIGRIAGTTQYQGSNLIDGSFGSAVDTNTANSTVLAVANVASATDTGAAVGTYAITANTTTHTLTMTQGSVSQTLSNAAGSQSLNFSTFGITINTTAAYAQDAAVGNVVVAAGAGGGGSFMVSSSGHYASSDLISVAAVNLSVAGLGLGSSNVLTAAGAQSALTTIDAAIDTANTAIGTIGAAESRLSFASTNVATISQNVTAAESTIRDADMAAETTAFSKFNILQQAGMAMLAQANSSAGQVLTLLH